MTSDTVPNQVQTWDMVAKSDGADVKWYKSTTMSTKDRNLMAFPVGSVLVKQLPEEIKIRVDNHLDSLSMDLVQMLTTGDIDCGWFVLRMFAYTSSSAYETLRFTAKLIQSNEDVYSAFNDVLGYGGLANLLPSPDDDDNENLQDNENESVMTEPSVKNWQTQCARLMLTKQQFKIARKRQSYLIQSLDDPKTSLPQSSRSFFLHSDYLMMESPA